MAQKHYDVVVIGGGAAGMMAACIAGSEGKKVLLLEQNKRLGEKLRISGGGRCNILNAEGDTRTLLSHFGDASKFLFSPFSQYGMQETWDFFESNGLPLKIEDRKRAFPQSESAEDVCSFFETLLQKHKVEVHKNTTVEELVKRSGAITCVRTSKGEFAGTSIILATGGVSRPETGATGDGFTWLTKLGHTVHNPQPTIVPLKVEEKWIRSLSGTSIPNAHITFTQGKQKKFSVRGPLLFTHFGLSGPTILNAAAKVQDLLHEGRVEAHIDLFPDETIGALNERILTLFEQHKNRTVVNALKEILPPGTSEVFTACITDLTQDTKVHSVTKEQRGELAHFLKKISLTIAGLMDPEHAVIADGGVDLTEIDTKTMRSKILKNVFITGDLLHIRRPTGGYSLQLCWTTGYVAGTHA